MKKLIKSNIRLVVPIGEPTEIREILFKSGRGQAVDAYAVRLEAGRKQKLEELADKAGITAPELIRILLEAAINVDITELTKFIRIGLAARKAKSKSGDDNEKLHFKIDRKDGPELDEDAGGERGSEFETPKTGMPIPERKRKKGQGTGTPRPGGRSA